MMHTAPLAMMGATFALVANGVQKAREQDDPLNYFIGNILTSQLSTTNDVHT